MNDEAKHNEPIQDIVLLEKHIEYNERNKMIYALIRFVLFST